MAIAKIKKLEIIGLEKDKDEFLSLLQKVGLVQLISLQTQDTGLATPAAYTETNLLEIEEAISYLASYRKERALLGGLVKFKPIVYAQQLREVISGFDYSALLQDLSRLRNHLKNIFQHKEKLIQEGQLLAPWRKLRISLDELRYQQRCGIILGILNRRDFKSLSEDLEKIQLNLFIETVYQDKANQYLTIIYLKEDFEQLEALLKNYHFNFITLSRRKCTVEERLLEIKREILVLERDIQETKFKITKLSGQQFQLMVVHDYLYNINKTQEADKNLAKQAFTFTLSGWMRQKDGAVLEREVAKRFKDVAIFISEPKEGEVVPVILENRRVIQPFEFITAIYGMPKYNELDPTPYLAPFFFLYFGFCISDVGYGIILVLFCWFMLKKFKLGPQGLRFFRLFLFCGISTILVGALTGSWFGNLFDLLAENNSNLLFLKKFKDRCLILDPLKEPTRLLGIALSFGIIQVWFGNLVAGIGNLKNKRYLDVILDQVPMFIFLYGLTGFGLIFLKLCDIRLINLFKYASLLGALVLIVTQGRSEKGIGAKIFYGIYNLYNTTSGYLSDILSYSRLWALGLVTGVMASTINLISIQFSQIFISAIPFINNVAFIKALISGLILIVLFVFGHGVSFLVNLLGAFVHPVRLQFVEFFSKFFKSGGITFRPFRTETKYINLSEATNYGTK